MLRQDNEQTKNLSRNTKRGVVTKNQWLIIEMVSRHPFEVTTQNAVESKIAKSQHGTEVTTLNLLRDHKNVVATKINIVGDKKWCRDMLLRSRHIFQQGGERSGRDMKL